MSEPSTKRHKTTNLPATVDFSEHVHNPTDLVIKVGENGNTVLIRLHSVFLKAASPVFTTMLEGTFVEGTKSYTDEDPLLLEDDDPQTFLEYLDIIYLVRTREDALPLSRVPDLAVLADKYGSAVKLRQTFSAALMPLLLDVPTRQPKKLPKSDIGMHDILLIAYLIGDAVMFWRASREIIAHAELSKPVRAHPKLLEVMPENLGMQLKKARDAEISQLDWRLGEVQSEIFDDYELISVDARMPCKGVLAMIGRYQAALTAVRDGHPAFALTTKRPGEAWTSILETKCHALDPDCPKGECCADCEATKWPDIHRIVEQAIENCQGLCLRCVRERADFKHGTGRLLSCEHKDLIHLA